MALEENVYTIPLRKHWVKVSRVDRVNTSVDVIRSFLIRHTKTEDIKLSPLLNESLWTRGAKKPPAFAKIKVVKDEKGVVNAMLPEERLEVTEKKGLKQKLLRKEGEKESKIVLEGKANTAEPKQPAANTGKTEDIKQPVPQKEEPKKQETKKAAKTEIKK